MTNAVFDEKKIWFWYEKIEECMAQQKTQTEFCRSNDLDLVTFKNIWYRIIFKKFSKPSEYKILVDFANEFKNSEESPAEFCRNRNINKMAFSECRTHLKYLKIIERIKKERDHVEQKMKFIQVPTHQEPCSIQHFASEPEVVESKNNIEIVITKGVKVIISPNLDAVKIIKIIEFLKDL